MYRHRCLKRAEQTEEALRQSQERARTLINSTSIGITIGEDDVIVEANMPFYA
ncbi:hypothetical protein [Ktedonobacter racemifer]|uniref:hypothetical protein n=1 Tax=Ktedonobacter racemifer TaxID=363277 RepID=UPI0002FA661A|nr:hypothetical protein [Ktedonobacter racemifer]